MAFDDRIFSSIDYKSYLLGYIKAQPKGGRGLRSQLAAAAGCQMAYMSQVLNGSVDLSLEQAIRINRYLGHSKDEAHFFLLLVQLARAGTKDTKAYFHEQIDEQLARRLVIKNRLALSQTLSNEDQNTYYGAWYFGAAHILTTIPGYRTKNSIAKKLGLPIEKTNEVLEFLQRTGLVELRGSEFFSGQAQIHLGSDSRMITRHHSNWRIKALESLDKETEHDLHYSAVVSLSRNDVTKLKAMIVKKIEELVAVVKESKEEELSCLCVDFFQL